MSNFESDQMDIPAPVIERVRHETRRRNLTVKSTKYITPGMLRIELTGEELSDFISLGADDHIKVFLASDGEKPEMRDYTPRRYSNDARELTLDFAVHEAGPATAWALDAKPGDTLQIGGPRGSAVVHGENIKQWVLIGDETALPAIGRRIEEAAPGTKITSIVTVADEKEHQNFVTEAEHKALWVHRPQEDATDSSALIETLKTLEFTPGTFVWVASEASVTRAVRSYLVDTLSFPLSWMKAAGYWVKGQADTTEKF